MAESFSSVSSLSLANAKSRKVESLYRCNGTTLSQNHSCMNTPPGWDLNCMDDRDDSSSQPKADHCIKEHEGSFGTTEVSSHKTGSYVDNNLNLNLDLTLWATPVERKHRVPHPKSIVQSAEGISTERVCQVPSPNRQDNNSEMHTESGNMVNAVDGFRWSYHKAIAGQPRPVYGTASVTLKENQQKTPVINWNEVKHLAFSSNISNQFRSFATNHFGTASRDGISNLNREKKGPFSRFYHNLTENHFRIVPDSIPTNGWPASRAYKRNSFGYLPKASRENQQGASFVQSQDDSLYVKVNIEGMLIGRKLDLNAYKSYESLSRGLENMFQRTIEDQIRACIAMGNKDIVKCLPLFDPFTDFELAYENSEGDRALVGDVPWEMFLHTVKRLWILKSSGKNPFAPKWSKKSGSAAYPSQSPVNHRSCSLYHRSSK